MNEILFNYLRNIFALIGLLTVIWIIINFLRYYIPV